MNRRAFLSSTSAAAAAALAPQLSQAAPSSPACMKPAICAYSFRKELQDKSMTYEDLITKCVEGTLTAST